jgi:hypothetical protein
VALIAVLLPAGSSVHGLVLPADAPAPLASVTGVPSSWYYAPPWTPPVTRHPMTAAVMVLEADLSYGGIFHRHGVRGPVLVSADGRTYASLPSWTDLDQDLQLSPDGREVAWYTLGRSAEPGEIHRLTLATGHQVAEWNPADGNGLTVLGGVHAGGDRDGHRHSRRVDGDPDTGRWQGRSAAPGVVAATRGAVQCVGPQPGRRVVGHAHAKRTAWSIAIRPFHSGSALVRQADRQKDLAITSAEPVSRVQVLAWSAAGIYLRVETSRGPGYSTHRSIRVIDPGTAATTVVSRPADGLGTFPIALASGLVTSATPIPVARPGILE